MITPNAGKNAEKRHLSHSAGENIKWYDHSGNNLAVSLKNQRAATTRPSKCTPGRLPQRNKNLCPHENLYMVVHSNFICNSLKLEATQRSFK